jgi:hypothetical protein
MTRRHLDVASLVAGVGLVAFGGVLLANALDVIDLSFAALGPLACLLLGAVLLASGLTRRV